MSKKVKCEQCENLGSWAMPEIVRNKNYDYAMHCLDAAKRTGVCDETGKVKNISNEQYCKYFQKCNENGLKTKEWEKAQIIELERKIKEYEKTLED